MQIFCVKIWIQISDPDRQALVAVSVQINKKRRHLLFHHIFLGWSGRRTSWWGRWRTSSRPRPRLTPIPCSRDTPWTGSNPARAYSVRNHTLLTFLILPTSSVVVFRIRHILRRIRILKSNRLITDPDPDPAVFVISFQKTNLEKNYYFFLIYFAYLLL